MFGSMFNTVLLVFCIVCLVCVFLLWPGKAKPAQRRPFYGRNIAHRGLHSQDKTVPENSIAAFNAAAEAGYGIELDIQLSKDSEVVVFHDDTLERVCGVQGRVDGYTLQELRQMRLLGTEEGIPLFAEMLAAVDGRVPLVVELKRGPRNRELCEKAWAILQQYEGDYCIESFDPRIVRWFKRNAPGVLRGQLSAAPRSLGGGVAGLAVGSLLTNVLCRPQFIAYGIGKKPFSADMADSGAMRVAWTARPGDDIERLEEKNDAIIFEFYTPPPQFKEMPENIR